MIIAIPLCGPSAILGRNACTLLIEHSTWQGLGWTRCYYSEIQVLIWLFFWAFPEYLNKNVASGAEGLSCFLCLVFVLVEAGPLYYYTFPTTMSFGLGDTNRPLSPVPLYIINGRRSHSLTITCLLPLLQMLGFFYAPRRNLSTCVTFL